MEEMKEAVMEEMKGAVKEVKDVMKEWKATTSQSGNFNSAASGMQVIEVYVRTTFLQS